MGIAALAAAALAASATAAAPTAAGAVNDPYFHLQWGDENSGQAIPTGAPWTRSTGPALAGTPFADDSASEAWSVTTGSSSIVIGEVDTGVEYNAPDLKANIWSNPGWIGGCARGTHGFDVRPATEGCDPMDGDETYGGHGTAVAGVMGAIGNNGLGIAGMNWHTTILPVRWLQNAETEEPTAVLVKALERFVTLSEDGVKIRVVNDSVTFSNNTERNRELERAIERLGERGILFVTAAGNLGVNDDEQSRYPCDYGLPNEICVSASNDRDELASWSDYGAHNVNLAAPGEAIYSTLRNGQYGYVSGTSMATAQVSGAAALILSAQPSLTATQVKADILGHVDRLPSLAGKVSSGGRLDVCEALPGCVDYAPPPPPPPGPPALPPPPPPQAKIAGLTVSPSVFKAARRGPAISSARSHNGATVRYVDSQQAVTEFTVLVARSGVLNAARHCVASPHTHRGQHGHPKRCTRYVPIARFARTDGPGANRFHFTGHIARLKLAPGRYRLQAMPVFDGRPGVAAVAGFRIIS
jgi:subtilisin family serine protease